MTTPKLEMDELVAGAIGNEVLVNEALRLLEATSQVRLSGFLVNTPAVSPDVGDVYALGAAPTGVWSGQAGNLAIYRSDTTYMFVDLTAMVGLVGIHPDGHPVAWNGTQWINPGVQVLAMASTINWDAQLGQVGEIEMDDAATMAAPTNLVAGMRLRLSVVQSGESSSTITWNGVFKWAAATAPTLSGGPGEADLLEFFVLSPTVLVGSVVAADYS